MKWLYFLKQGRYFYQLHDIFTHPHSSTRQQEEIERLCPQPDKYIEDINGGELPQLLGKVMRGAS